MEKAPQVWVGLHGHISPEARLLAPCWIGAHVYVGPGAVIGPGAILENGAFIEGESEIKGSVVGPATFVGQYLTITDSLAWGHTLVNWRTGTESTISDEFLLCSVNRERSTHKGIPLLDRAKEWLNGWGDQPSMEPQPILAKKSS
jgi:NDP-sugar pyrophosphorylase family protein